jgi:hypothetical protein
MKERKSEAFKLFPVILVEWEIARISFRFLSLCPAVPSSPAKRVHVIKRFKDPFLFGSVPFRCAFEPPLKIQKPFLALLESELQRIDRDILDLDFTAAPIRLRIGVASVPVRTLSSKCRLKALYLGSEGSQLFELVGLFL